MDSGDFGYFAMNYTSSGNMFRTSLGDNLFLNQISLWGKSLKLTPALARFKRSDTARIKLLVSARRT